MTRRNWARGAPPPPDSWEWSGTGVRGESPTKIPKEKWSKMTRQPTAYSRQPTAKKKGFPWGHTLGAFAVGLIVGGWGRRD